jgi:hypothetical protein
MSIYTVITANKTTLKGTLTDLIKMNLSKTDTPLKTNDVPTNESLLQNTEEILIPVLEEEVAVKEKVPIKKKCTIAQRRPVRETRSKPQRYVDVSSDSSETPISVDSNEEDGTRSESDSDTPPEERLDEPDSDDLDFLADDAKSYSDDDEKDFEPDSDTASTDSIPDSSSETSSDFDEGTLLSDDLSL